MSTLKDNQTTYLSKRAEARVKEYQLLFKHKEN